MPSRLPDRLVKSADILLDIVVLMLSILAGVISYYNLPAKVVAQYEGSFLIAVGCFLVGLTAHQTFRAITAEDKLKELGTSFDVVLKNSTHALQHFEFLASEQRIRDLRRSLNEKEDLIQRAGLKTVDEYLASLRSSEGVRGIKVQGEQLALAAYENFWITLVEHQAKCKSAPANAFGAARITHSSSMKVWDTEIGRALIRHQERYVELGGVIVRILLDTPARPDPMVESIMKRMMDAGIHVYYLQEGEAENLLSDFLWVGPYELSWRAGASRKALQECELMQINDVRQAVLRRAWTDLGSRVIAREHSLPDLVKDILETPAIE
ncbi:MAG TPA: hypothetical protein VME23_15090 [Terracidiphilus sp.]|nr:hypothetical protein [Terracidiphilus sp.]